MYNFIKNKNSPIKQLDSFITMASN